MSAIEYGFLLGVGVTASFWLGYCVGWYQVSRERRPKAESSPASRNGPPRLPRSSRRPQELDDQERRPSYPP